MILYFSSRQSSRQKLDEISSHDNHLFQMNFHSESCLSDSCPRHLMKIKMSSCINNGDSSISWSNPNSCIHKNKQKSVKNDLHPSSKFFLMIKSGILDFPSMLVRGIYMSNGFLI